MIWRSGFESGELVAHVFDDVPPALAAWADSGLDVRIYSSGSIEAQQLFFGHTAAGDLRPLLRGHYDTTTGPKREPASYTAIAADMGLTPRQVLFVSDVGAELDAARAAGMATALAIRPGNREPGGIFEHEPIESFAEIVT
jgi:enolase-phosphatase E1